MTANNRHYTQLSAREFAPIREALQDAPDVPRHILQHLERLEERYARALEEVAHWQANWAAATNQAQRDIAEAHARSADCAEHGREIIYLRERAEILEAELDQERDMRAHLTGLLGALRDAVENAQGESLTLSRNRVKSAVRRVQSALSRVRSKTDKKREAIYARTERALKELWGSN